MDHPIRLSGRVARPDIVFSKRKVAIFVDGCFWHCCPTHGSIPATNVEYWVPKLERNTKRDAATDAALLAAGWTVVRAWEHEPAEEVVERITAALSWT